MSADNWTECPRCTVKYKAAADAAIRAAEDAYGKVPVDEWKDLEAAAKVAEEKPVPATFREDYEFYGASEGVVTASYSGRCTECGLSLKFKHEVKIEGIEAHP